MGKHHADNTFTAILRHAGAILIVVGIVGFGLKSCKEATDHCTANGGKMDNLVCRLPDGTVLQ